ncbi:MAG TPA: MFS transporter [Patescibacteria group bacterium]|nr:MFS transporter [Patescibacteria group bacterium]
MLARHFFKTHISPELKTFFLSAGLADIAFGMGMVFEPVFLYSVVGFSLQKVLLYFACVYGLYALLAPLGAKFVSRLGLSGGYFLGCVLQVLYWIAFVMIPTNSYFAVIACIIFGIQKSVFWPSYHALMFEYRDKRSAGREFSYLYSVVIVGYILSPYFAGVLSQQINPSVPFYIAMVVYLFSGVLLLVKLRPTLKHKVTVVGSMSYVFKMPGKFIGYAGFGEEVLHFTAWSVFVFLTVGSFEGFGLFAALAGFFSAIAVLVTGKLSDVKGNGELKVLSVMNAIFYIVRAIMPASVGGLFVADALGRTTKDQIFVAVSSDVYHKPGRENLEYSAFFEQSLAIGKALACLLGVVLFTMTGGSFASLFILAAIFSLLYLFI